MSVTYFKRYRMEIDLRQPLFSPPPLPKGYALLPWETSLLGAHARAKFESFHREIDADVFPCLAQRRGCRRLMEDIAGRGNFMPEATWLVVNGVDADSSTGLSDELNHRTSVPVRLDRGRLRFRLGRFRFPIETIGTVQGLRARQGVGSIQNIGISPKHRGLGLGSILMHRALSGFQQGGLSLAYLEVTAQNLAAIRLYCRLGFRPVDTVYKASEPVCA